jgi:hypothetical protein
LDQQGDKTVPATLGGTNPIIPCETWEADTDPIQLPPLPLLPDLTGESTEDQDLTQLIKIAGLDNHLIGLTNKGHVLKFGSLQDELTVSRGSWEYVSDLFDKNRMHNRHERSYQNLVKFTEYESTRPFLIQTSRLLTL